MSSFQRRGLFFAIHFLRNHCTILSSLISMVLNQRNIPHTLVPEKAFLSFKCDVDEAREPSFETDTTAEYCVFPRLRLKNSPFKVSFTLTVRFPSPVSHGTQEQQFRLLFIMVAVIREKEANFSRYSPGKVS